MITMVLTSTSWRPPCIPRGRRGPDRRGYAVRRSQPPPIGRTDGIAAINRPDIKARIAHATESTLGQQIQDLAARRWKHLDRAASAVASRTASQSAALRPTSPGEPPRL